MQRPAARTIREHALGTRSELLDSAFLRGMFPELSIIAYRMLYAVTDAHSEALTLAKARAATRLMKGGF
jgi:hypothetical protein